MNILVAVSHWGQVNQQTVCQALHLDKSTLSRDLARMRAQGSVFVSLLARTTSQIRDVVDAEVWGMHPATRYIDELKPISENSLYAVRSTPGVAWAVRLNCGLPRAKAVAGQTLYLFTLDNLRQYGALKAIGVPNRAVVRMVLLQSAVVGATGYAFGSAMCVTFFVAAKDVTHLRGFITYFEILGGTGALMALIVLAASVLSVRRVVTLELRDLQHQMEVAYQHIGIQQELLDLTTALAQGGLATDVDVARARAQLTTPRASLPAVRRRCRRPSSPCTKGSVGDGSPSNREPTSRLACCVMHLSPCGAEHPAGPGGVSACAPWAASSREAPDAGAMDP